MRSLHTEALECHPRPVAALSLCVLCSPCGHYRRFAFALPRCLAHPSTFLPPVPRRSFALCPSRGFSPLRTMKALTPAPLTDGAGLPVYLATLSCRSISNHVDCLVIAYHHASVTSEFRTSPFRRRGEQPEANCRSVRQTNSIRRGAATSLRFQMWRPDGRTIPAFAGMTNRAECVEGNTPPFIFCGRA